MANKNKERIAGLLAAYGSDAARWPEGERDCLRSLASDARAELLREHEALDQLLAGAAKAANEAAPSDALMSRIMMAAPATQMPTEVAGKTDAVIPFAPRGVELAASEPPMLRKREWTAVAALMAASLVLGVFVGTSERVQSTAAQMGELAGVSIDAPLVQTSALDEAFWTQDDEEIL